jgi:hypothetical protein
MRIVREKVAWLAIQVRKIAATAARHQDLLSNPIGAFEYEYVSATPGGRDRAHETCCASSNYQDVGICHCRRIAGKRRFLCLVPGFIFCESGDSTLSIRA